MELGLYRWAYWAGSAEGQFATFLESVSRPGFSIPELFVVVPLVAAARLSQTDVSA